MKPTLTIDLIAPEGNIYAMVAKAQSSLPGDQAIKLGEEVEQLTARAETTYQNMRALIEQYCTVTWLNEYARFKEAAADTQETAAKLSDILEDFRLDLDKHQPIEVAQAHSQIQTLREALDALEETLNLLPAHTVKPSSPIKSL